MSVTPELNRREELEARVGKDAVEVWNIAHGRYKEESPCPCFICAERLEAVAKWLKERKP